jgi:L-asparaginase II
MGEVAVEVVRGGRVESRHRVDACVIDASGGLRLAAGDIDGMIYPRSAIKPFQALALVETGAADALAVSEAELALACASHGGEPMHVERVAAWLARLGLEERHLACGPHPPMHAASAAALVARGERPTRLHNNCSGKHTGLLAACLHQGWLLEGYARADHPVQSHIAASLARAAGLANVEAPGIDGCSLPAFVLPLRALARAAASLAVQGGALQRIGRAMRAHPELVAGTGRLCTDLMRAAPELIAKTGAEGVFLAAAPAQGLGIALKAHDGATRAAEVALLTLLDRLGLVPESAAAALARHARPTLRDWNGAAAGEIRPAPGWPS